MKLNLVTITTMHLVKLVPLEVSISGNEVKLVQQERHALVKISTTRGINKWK